MRVLLKPGVEILHKMKLTFKISISLKSLKVLPRDLDQKNATPTFSHGKGRWGKSLRTIIN
jgi:hypothetical protein